MKLVKIIHYVEKSFEGKPSFVILMDDGKEYISNGCVWLENTKENLGFLKEKYECSDFLEELFSSPEIEMCNVIDASYMFCNSELTEFSSDMSSVGDASFMFSHSKITKFSADMSSVTDASWMFYNTKLEGENF